MSGKINRRELVRVGGLGLAGLTLADLVGTRPAFASAQRTFGHAKNVIFLYLNGGPPQHETFDPKPNAPAEIRGPFNPIQTNVAGTQFCELLPRTSLIADKIAVVRSMATNDNVHSSSGHWVLTGYKYQGTNARKIQTTDWPSFGSIVKRYRPSDKLPALSTVMIPDVIRLNENVMPAGQTGGLMGARWTPERFVGDPSRASYQVEGLEPLGITTDRFRQRKTLSMQLEDRLREADRNPALDLLNTYQQQAFDLLTSGKARRAFDISQEPASVRDRYGRNRWGQCVLLARRLIEAGVRLVHVNWPREPGDNAVDNPLWDTHAQNPDRVEDVLCPMFDVGFSALIEDLDRRGMLDETLVVTIGEFGRTPKINAKAGRDHWGSVFSFAMAGAGVQGGALYGSSDNHGGYPASGRVEPGHLTATIFHLLGLDHHGTLTDPSGRELPLTKQSPIWEILSGNSHAATVVRSTADVSRVPPFDESRILANTNFVGQDPVKPFTAQPRPKGWRVMPKLLREKASGLGAAVSTPRSLHRLKFKQHVTLGLHVDDEAGTTFAANAEALLGQEVRSPFAGTYKITADLIGDAVNADYFAKYFVEQFDSQLIYFQFTEKQKLINSIRPLATQTFTPQFIDSDTSELQRVEFQHTFLNPNPGANFSFGLGLGVGILLKRKSEAAIRVSQGRAVLRVASIRLEFLGKEVNQDVMV